MSKKGQPLPQRRSIAQGSPAATSASAVFPLDARSGPGESMREDEEREIRYSHVLGKALAILYSQWAQAISWWTDEIVRWRSG